MNKRKMYESRYRHGVAVVFILLFSVSKVYGQMYIHQIYDRAQSELVQYNYAKTRPADDQLINLYGFFAHRVSALVQKNKDGSYSYVVTYKGTGGHGGFYFPELAEKFKYMEIRVDKNNISYYKQESQFVASDAYTENDTRDPMKIGHMKVPEDPFQTGNTMDMLNWIVMLNEGAITEEEFANHVAIKVHKPGNSSYKTKVQINGKEYEITVRRSCTHSRKPLYRGTYDPGYNAGVAVTTSPSGWVTQTVDRFPDHWFKHKVTLTYSLDEMCRKTGMSKQDLIIYLMTNDVLDLPNRNAFIVCAYKAFGFDKCKEQHRINDSIAREQIWNQQIANEKDYKRVENCAKNKVVGKEYLYTKDFVKRIMNQSQKLKNDSINNLFRMAQKSMAVQHYRPASDMAHQILKIDSTNSKALQVCYLSDLELIKEGEKKGSVNENDYVVYLKNFPSSPYLQEVKNRRALYACSLLDKNSTDDEINHVYYLPCDAETSKVVDKRCEQLKFALHHGPFIRFPVGGEMAFGANSSISAEIDAQFGCLAHMINFKVGAKYNDLSNTFGSANSLQGGYFSKNYISIPATLRMNFVRDFDFAMYFGIGAELNVKTMGSSYVWKNSVKDMSVKDVNFSNNELTVSPRLSIGMIGNLLLWSDAIFDCELFVSYDRNNPFDINYIDDYASCHAGEMLIHPDAYECMANAGFIDKVRVGVSIKYSLNK